MPTGADKAAEFAKLIEALWAANGQPCSRRAIDAAMVSASRRGAAFHPAKAVLAHGDAHAWNTLAKLDGTGRYAFIDPDGAFAEPAFDLAVLMREWGDRMPEGDLAELAQRRCAHLNRLTGVATADIWDWSLLQCLSSGLDLMRIGARQAAAPQLAMADAWAERIEAFA